MNISQEDLAAVQGVAGTVCLMQHLHITYNIFLSYTMYFSFVQHCS